MPSRLLLNGRSSTSYSDTTRRSRCRERAGRGELECEIVSSSADGVLVSPDLSGLTTAHCARVRSHGVRVVGLARDSHERQQLHALGVDVIVEPVDPPAAFVGALRGPTEQASVEWQEPERVQAGTPGTTTVAPFSR